MRRGECGLCLAERGAVWVGGGHDDWGTEAGVSRSARRPPPVCTRLSGTSGVTPLFKAVPATRPMSCWPRRGRPRVSSRQPPPHVQALEGGDSSGHTEGWGQGWT